MLLLSSYSDMLLLLWMVGVGVVVLEKGLGSTERGVGAVETIIGFITLLGSQYEVAVPGP